VQDAAKCQSCPLAQNLLFLFRITEAYGLAPVKPQHSTGGGRQQQNNTSRPPVQLLVSERVGTLEYDYALNLV
jgi:hypothetical protein